MSRITFLLLAACGASVGDTPSVDHTTATTPTANEHNDGPANEEVSTDIETGAAPGSACEQAFDCHIVHDNCGAPHGRRLGDNTPPAHVNNCPPALYAPTEPECEASVCTASTIFEPSFRQCSVSAECVVIRGSCAVPMAVAVSKSREAQDAIAMRDAVIDCVEYSDNLTLRAECYSGYCIVRR